jgi:hypothetical protein
VSFVFDGLDGPGQPLMAWIRKDGYEWFLEVVSENDSPSFGESAGAHRTSAGFHPSSCEPYGRS